MQSIHNSYRINAPIDQVWECLVNPDEIEAWGGGPAEMTEVEGTDFSFWGGDIHGTNLEIIPNERIVQEWYAGEWDEPSRVTITLYDDIESTHIELVHENIPDEELDKTEQGWDEYFFGAIKSYLEEEE